MTDDLSDLLAALADSIEPLTEAGLATEYVEEIATLQEKVQARRSLAPGTLLVALAGTTGAGKSSVFNALAGGDYSRAGVLRPTTSEPVSVIFGEPEPGVGGLLDWLEVADRVSVPAPEGKHGRLVLLDLPDIDSITAANREVAERYMKMADVIVWVVDPEKYADSRVHDDYLRPYAAFAPVMDVVINQVDRLTEAQTSAATEDLRHLLKHASIDSAVFATSTLTGAGVPELRENLWHRAAKQRDQEVRLVLDARAIAAELAATHPFTRSYEETARAAVAVFPKEVADVVGTAAFADAAAREYRHALRRRTAWPPLRVFHKARPFPARAKLYTGHLPQPVGRLLLGLAGEGGWPVLLRHTVEHDYLTAGIRGYRPPQIDASPCRWARFASALGWISVFLLVAAAVLFGVEMGVRYFGLTLPPALPAVPAGPPYPALPSLPWSAVTAILALVVTALIAGFTAIARKVSTHRFRSRVHAEVSGDIAQVVEKAVTHSLSKLLAAGAEFRQTITKITGKP